MKISKFFVRNVGSYSLTNDAPKWLKDAIDEAHQGSFPSNHLYDLAQAFADMYDDYYKDLRRDERDDFAEFADGQVDVYDNDLYQFAADYSSTRWYDDESAKDFIEDSKDPTNLIKAVQYIVARNVARVLWDACKDAENEEE